MKSTILNLREDLFQALSKIENSNTDSLSIAKKSLSIVNHNLSNLRQIVIRNQFESQEDEIWFFKEFKPSILSKKLYFTHIFDLKSGRHMGDESYLKEFFIAELSRVNTFFADNLDFCCYYRNKMSCLDDKYFVRGNMELSLCIVPVWRNALLDASFSTSHDHLVAHYIAYEQFAEYIKQQLNLLASPANYRSTGVAFQWTDSKTALVELIYALHSSGCINNGCVDIKLLASNLSAFFNIDLGDVYREFSQIKARQRQTKFIDSLKKTLLKRINEDGV